MYNNEKIMEKLQETYDLITNNEINLENDDLSDLTMVMTDLNNKEEFNEIYKESIERIFSENDIFETVEDKTTFLNALYNSNKEQTETFDAPEKKENTEEAKTDEEKNPAETKEIDKIGGDNKEVSKRQDESNKEDKNDNATDEEEKEPTKRNIKDLFKRKEEKYEGQNKELVEIINNFQKHLNLSILRQANIYQQLDSIKQKAKNDPIDEKDKEYLRDIFTDYASKYNITNLLGNNLDHYLNIINGPKKEEKLESKDFETEAQEKEIDNLEEQTEERKTDKIEDNIEETFETPDELIAEIDRIIKRLEENENYQANFLIENKDAIVKEFIETIDRENTELNKQEQTEEIEQKKKVLKDNKDILTSENDLTNESLKDLLDNSEYNNENELYLKVIDKQIEELKAQIPDEELVVDSAEIDTLDKFEIRVNDENRKEIIDALNEIIDDKEELKEQKANINNPNNPNNKNENIEKLINDNNLAEEILKTRINIINKQIEELRGLNQKQEKLENLKKEYEELKEQLYLDELDPAGMMLSDYEEHKERLNELETELANISSKENNQKTKAEEEKNSFKKEIENLQAKKGQLEKDLNKIKNQTTSKSNKTEIQNKIAELETKRYRLSSIPNENKELKAIKDAYNTIRREAIDILSNSQSFKNASKEEQVDTISTSVETHDAYSILKNYKGIDTKTEEEQKKAQEKLIKELKEDIANVLVKEKETERITEQEPKEEQSKEKSIPKASDKEEKLYLKALAGASGFALGVGTAMLTSGIPATIVVGAAITGVKVYSNKLAPKVDNKIEKIQSIENYAKEKPIKNKILTGVKKVNKFLQSGYGKWFVNGFTIGYIGGKVVKGITDTMQTNESSPQEVTTEATRQTTPTEPSPTTPTDTPTVDTNTIPDIKKGMKLTLDKDIKGAIDAEGHKFGSLSDAHINVNIDKVKGDWVHVKDAIKVGGKKEAVGWIKKEDLIESLKEGTSTIAKHR